MFVYMGIHVMKTFVYCMSWKKTVKANYFSLLYSFPLFLIICCLSVFLLFCLHLCTFAATSGQNNNKIINPVTSNTNTWMQLVSAVGAMLGVCGGSLYISFCVRKMLQKTNSTQPEAVENVFSFCVYLMV